MILGYAIGVFVTVVSRSLFFSRRIIKHRMLRRRTFLKRTIYILFFQYRAESCGHICFVVKSMLSGPVRTRTGQKSFQQICFEVVESPTLNQKTPPNKLYKSSGHNSNLKTRMLWIDYLISSTFNIVLDIRTWPITSFLELYLGEDHEET
jgi:hypothetical protein